MARRITRSRGGAGSSEPEGHVPVKFSDNGVPNEMEKEGFRATDLPDGEEEGVDGDT